MKIAHLIITYTNPLQTERMVKRMMHKDIDFYIHLDKKQDIRKHLYLKELPNVYFIKSRIDVHWAGFSTVEAILNSIREVLQTGKQYDYINLLSGQDYPIKTPQEILQFYTENKGKEFIKYDSFEDWTEAISRVTKYHMVDFYFKGKYTVERLMNFFLPKRVSPVPYKYYGRSMFWTLSPQCLSYVLKVYDEIPALKSFFRYTWGPDEFFFQTILLNSDYAHLMVNKNCQFYNHKPHCSHPELLTSGDFQILEKSDKLYARKFDMSKDVKILDMIDKMLDNKIALSRVGLK